MKTANKTVDDEEAIKILQEVEGLEQKQQEQVLLKR